MGLKFNPITSTLDLVGSGTTYTLPTASASVLGGVKIGSRLSIDGSGVLSADVQSGGGDFMADGSVPMTGTLNLATGTTTIAPIKMTSGTNLTTPVAGVFEFDGTNLYFSV